MFVTQSDYIINDQPLTVVVMSGHQTRANVYSNRLFDLCMRMQWFHWHNLINIWAT